MKRLVFSNSMFETYIYIGPATNYKDEFLGYFKIETQAPTVGRAKSNIQFKIKSELRLSKDAKINIDLSCLKHKPAKNISRQPEVLDSSPQKEYKVIQDHLPFFEYED